MKLFKILEEEFGIMMRGDGCKNFKVRKQGKDVYIFKAGKFVIGVQIDKEILNNPKKLTNIFEFACRKLKEKAMAEGFKTK